MTTLLFKVVAVCVCFTLTLKGVNPKFFFKNGEEAYQLERKRVEELYQAKFNELQQLHPSLSSNELYTMADESEQGKQYLNFISEWSSTLAGIYTNVRSGTSIFISLLSDSNLVIRLNAAVLLCKSQSCLRYSNALVKNS